MPKQSKIYTVSQVSSLIKEVLENNLPGRLTVTGELTDWKLHHSGHCYFSLKDEGSQLPCVMWKSSFSKVKFEPENGLAVLATGHIDVYSPQGKYQFYVERMQPAGVGALQLAFEQMVKRLEAEGLFDESHKKPLPAYPQRIGIVTSESGAAVHDITDSIHNRWPCTRLFLYPVAVQGEGAAQEIAAGLRNINDRNRQLKLDILIVGRGGGSLEDLWAFNEEVLVRAIFDSKIPVISAVGHEVDTTIADLVADARASTPTKAGVTAVPDMQEVLAHLAAIESRLQVEATARLRLARQNLETVLASAVFRSPLLPIHNREQQLDHFSSRLGDLIRDLLTEVRATLHASYEQIVKIEPHRLLGKKTVDLNGLCDRMNVGVGTVFDDRQMQLANVENRLAQMMNKLVVERQRRLSASYEQVVRIKPHQLIGQRMVELSSLRNQVNVRMSAILNRERMRLASAENRLAGLNPRMVLQRGYSITSVKQTGRLVRKSDEVQIGDLLTTELAGENLIESKVTKK
jgi:exodeoxyribonuclease VII large subunit